MRVFVLCTGRSGSASLVKACSHIQNFTSGHESHAKEILHRLEYRDEHIEVDNRLSWFLGGLYEKYGDTAFYVHLIRERESCVKSFNQRWNNHSSIIRAFASGILKQNISKLTAENKLEIANLYYDTVNMNIEFFLREKDQKMTIYLENINEDFLDFWKRIDAKGDLQSALSIFDKPLNLGPPKKKSIITRIFNK